jgi:hypothetical protein
MRASESHRQPDLFASAEVDEPDRKEPLFGYMSPDYVLEYRRPEAEKMLKLVREAAVFPWPNLTKAMTEEMRFNSMVRLFPPAEGRALLEAYAVEVARVYELIDEPWEPLYYAVLLKRYE